MIKKTSIWTWILPDENWEGLPQGWIEHGGKWLVYGKLGDMERLAGKIDGLIQKKELVLSQVLERLQ
jgi:hypothetical protein